MRWLYDLDAVDEFVICRNVDDVFAKLPNSRMAAQRQHLPPRAREASQSDTYPRCEQRPVAFKKRDSIFKS
jgi:hypothetical protein